MKSESSTGFLFVWSFQEIMENSRGSRMLDKACALPPPVFLLKTKRKVTLSVTLL